MTRAVPVHDSFDPVPSLTTVPEISVGVEASVPTSADVVAVLVRPGAGAGGASVDDLAAAGFGGTVGATFVLAGRPPIVLVGAGEAAVDAATARDLGAAAAVAVPSAARIVVDTGGCPLDAVALAGLVEGVLLARYSWDVLQSGSSATPVAGLVVVAEPTDELQAAARRGHTEALATCVARDLANCPPAHLTAVRWGEVAERVGPSRGLQVEVFDRDWLLAERCGGIIAVNGGSDEPPTMVKMVYEPSPEVANGRHVAVVGKGLTYDSGGLAIKPGDRIHAMMKNDMSGGGALFAAMLVLAELEVPTKVTAFLMCTDNMPSGTAFKMGDVITHRDGTTVEVLNTDAEGRLVMADALVMAKELGPDAVVDIATLTGACMRALGTEIGGVMGTDQSLVDQVLAAGAATSEPMWQLPMGAHFRAELSSDVADLTNLGDVNAGASSAAEFLAHFVEGVPWAHIDIAGVAAVARPGGWRPRGMSGFGARLLVEVLEQYRPSA